MSLLLPFRVTVTVTEVEIAVTTPEPSTCHAVPFGRNSTFSVVTVAALISIRTGPSKFGGVAKSGATVFHGYVPGSQRVVAVSALVPRTSTIRKDPVDGQFVRNRRTVFVETALRRATCISRSTFCASVLSLVES